MVVLGSCCMSLWTSYLSMFRYVTENHMIVNADIDDFTWQVYHDMLYAVVKVWTHSSAFGTQLSSRQLGVF